MSIYANQSKSNIALLKMAYLLKFLAFFSALMLLSLGQSLVDADTNDHLYKSVFRYSSKKRSLSYIIDALISMNSTLDGLSMIDPRRAQVSFWLDATENDESKCSKRQDQQLLSMLQQDRLIAEQERKKGRLFNLETYVEYVRTRTLVYCAYTIGAAFVREIDGASERSGDDLFDLQPDQVPEHLEFHELGVRVGHIILRRLNQTGLIELSRSLGNTNTIRELYQHYSPCSEILRILERYKDYYGLLTVSGNYEKSDSGLKSAIDKISVCKFIRRHNQLVFEATADYLHSTLRNRLSSSVRAQNNDDRYDSIFKFRPQQRTVAYIRMALTELDSYRSGLTTGDPRREEVSFWIEAARHDDSKCNIEDDEYMETHLERVRSRAIRFQRMEDYQASVFNLETYFESIRSDRLLYCESRFAVSFINKLTQLNKSSYIDICALSRGLVHSSQKDAQLLGRRVGELILRRSSREEERELRQSCSPEFIKHLYVKYSPCTGLLECAGEYEGYLSLISAPRNYLKVRPVLRNWIDKISVCKFVDQSEQVFATAADKLRHRHQ